MKRILLSILVGFLLLSAISLDVSAAKKSSKLSKEAITEMSDNIDKLTEKIYGRALLSPQDNETLIGIKIKLDNQMLLEPDPALAPLYYKVGNMYKMREMTDEATECFQTILENFGDTALAPKAYQALKDMGVDVTQFDSLNKKSSDEDSDEEE